MRLTEDLLTRPWYLAEAPDDAGGGEAGGEHVPDPEASEDVAGSPPAEPDDDEDHDPALEDLLVEDDEDEGRPLEERVKALSKRNRKLRRQMAKRAAVLQRIKDPAEFDSITRDAEAYRAIAREAQRNPRLRQAIFGASAGEDQSEGPAAKPARPKFDRKALPFDADENPVNRYLADQFESLQAMREALDQVRQEVQGTRQQVAQTHHQRAVDQWKGAVDGASKRITNVGLRRAFEKAMALEFAQSRGQRDVATAIKDWLTDFGVPSKEASAANAAARQRIAEGNARRPLSQGRPVVASAARPGDGEKKTLASIRRRLAAGS